jgi:lysozyme family protein
MADTRSRTIGRRTFVAGAAAAATAGTGLPLLGDLALAQTAAPADAGIWREFLRIASEAERLGLSAPRMSLGVEASGDFRQIMPALVDLVGSIESSASAATAPAGEVVKLVEQSTDLLQRVTQAERSPPTDRDMATGAAVTTGRPTYDALKDGYVELFRTCRIREQNQTEVGWYVSKLLDPANRAQYQKVEDEVCVPWYFVGIIHALECSFNFKAHLHNGDPLRARTVQIPRGRPTPWNPPNDWISSAKDSLAYEKFVDLEDWSLPRTLFRWEAYNGFRSRANGINTPYLWSFSNHYTRGKFVADNVWDANAVSKQCGAAVMLKALLERGGVTLPA